MQPCAANRESLALLAASVSGHAESARLQAHLKACPACRDYLAELRAICAEQAGAARAVAVVEVRPRILRRVASAVRASPPSGKPDWLAALRPGALRFAGAAGLLLLCLGGLALLGPAPWSGHPQAHLDAGRRQDPIAAVPAGSGGDPRFLGYRLALNRSPEAFERMLSAEEARTAHATGTPVPRNLARAEVGF